MTPPVSGEILPRNSEKAIFNLGNLEVAVVGWEVIENLQIAHGTRQLQDEYERYIVVDLAIKNISDAPVDADVLGPLSNFYQFLLVDENGLVVRNQILDSYVYFRFASGAPDKPYGPDYKGRWEKQIPHDEADVHLGRVETIAPKIAVLGGVFIAVPNGTGDVKRLGLAIRPLQAVLPNPHTFRAGGDSEDPSFWSVDSTKLIKVGEVAQNYSLLPDDLVINPVGTSVELDLTNFNLGVPITVGLNKILDERECCLMTAKINSVLSSEKMRLAERYFEIVPIYAYLADGRVVTLDVSKLVILSGNELALNRWFAHKNYDNCVRVDLCWQSRLKPVDLAGSTIVAQIGPYVVAWELD